MQDLQKYGSYSYHIPTFYKSLFANATDNNFLTFNLFQILYRTNVFALELLYTIEGLENKN
jgi:hypothetical protein